MLQQDIYYTTHCFEYLLFVFTFYYLLSFCPSLIYTTYLSEIRYLKATRQNLPLHYDVKRSNRVEWNVEQNWMWIVYVDSIFKWKICMFLFLFVSLMLLLFRFWFVGSIREWQHHHLAWKNPCMVVLLQRCWVQLSTVDYVVRSGLFCECFFPHLWTNI